MQLASGLASCLLSLVAPFLQPQISWEHSSISIMIIITVMYRSRPPISMRPLRLFSLLPRILNTHCSQRLSRRKVQVHCLAEHSCTKVFMIYWRLYHRLRPYLASYGVSSNRKAGASWWLGQSTRTYHLARLSIKDLGLQRLLHRARHHAKEGVSARIWFPSQ